MPVELKTRPLLRVALEPVVMQRLEHEINGETVVHYDSPQGADHALCGQDLCGDETGGDAWTEARPTTRRVTCEHCRAVVAHVRGKAA